MRSSGALILAGGVKDLAEATVLLLLAVFTVVSIALLRLKLRKTEPAVQFEVPAFVPLLGAIICATLIIVRVHSGITSTQPQVKNAPLIAGAILVVGLILYAVIRPKEVREVE